MKEPKLLPAVVVLLSIACYECRPRGRILGGSESLLQSRPYMVSLQVEGKHICGGLLISDEWVLSAAHCKPDRNFLIQTTNNQLFIVGNFTNKKALSKVDNPGSFSVNPLSKDTLYGENINKTLQAVLGTNSLLDPKKTVYDIDTQIVHPEYNRSTKHNDLLLLKLPEKVPLSKSISPLPYQTEDVVIEEKTLCLVAGWGKIKRTGKKPDLLNEGWVPVISRETCNRRDYYHGEITANMICAGDNRRDSCEGDSGGPLICNGVAEAVVSSGFSVCGNLKRPGKYTRIYPYNEWIIHTMRNVTEPTTAVPTVRAQV